jgi:hypothetical protein
VILEIPDYIDIVSADDLRVFDVVSLLLPDSGQFHGDGRVFVAKKVLANPGRTLIFLAENPQEGILK